MVCLSGADKREAGEEDTHKVDLDSGGVPTCAISAPDPDPDDPYYADLDIFIDGTCADVGGETAAADLELWFRTTYRDEENQTVSEEFNADDDTGDTGGSIMSFETSSNEARLYGHIFLPPADHNLCLFARDESGNKNGDDTCISFTVEPPNTPPWCEIVQPADGATGGVGDSVHFAAQVGDDDQSASSLYVEWSTNQDSEPIGYGTPDSEGWVNIDEAVAFDESETHEITLYVEDDEGESCTATVDYTVGSGPYVEIFDPDPLTDLDERTFGLTEAIPFEAHYNDNETECGDLSVVWTYEPHNPDDPKNALEKPFPGWDTEGDASCSSIQIYDPTSEDVLADADHYTIRVMVTDADGYFQSAPILIGVADCSQDWYLDLDGDGYGSTEPNDVDGDGIDDAVISDCSQPSGYVATAGDCDDYNLAINPGASETCNGLDDNCDGTVDTGFHTIWFYQDADGDGYGDDSVMYDADGDGTADQICSSASLPGWSALGGDCDDSQPDINPGEAELCDDTDHDCDGDIDNGFTYPYGTILYEDADGDGYGASPLETCEPVPGYVPTPDDCDDCDINVNPGEAEICNSPDPIDDNCDGVADPVGLTGYCTDQYLDGDGDGYGTDAGTSACVCLSNPGLYTATNTGDCDDSEYSINPDATEICDDADADEDCDGNSDLEGSSGCEDLYYDIDGDDYYASGAGSRCLCESDGYYGGHLPGDCNDGDPSINPDAFEVCDASNVDEDCDGAVNDDDSSVSGQDTWYEDDDSDTYGNPSSTLARCDQPSGYVSDNTDCDDGDNSINPGATEICDPSNTDEDCNGAADDADVSPTGLFTWYRDADSDAYGWASTTTPACDQPSGYVSNDDDCDDSSSTINPDATETVGDGVDYDCDGTELCYDDDDNDGWLDTSGDTRASSDTDCSDSYEGSSSDPTSDCDDTNSSIHPGASESACSGVDYDCSGGVTCYVDADYDGHRSSTAVTSVDMDCSDVGESCVSSVDCLDSNPYAFPGSAELESTSSCREDADGDGYGDSSPPSGVTAGDDCNDGSTSYHPGASEPACSGYNYNCSAGVTCYADADYDGHRSSTAVTSVDMDCSDTGESCVSSIDCLDSNPYAFPGSAERESSSSCREDYDGDGYGDASPPSGVTAGGDCNDSTSYAYPGASYTPSGTDWTDHYSTTVYPNSKDSGNEDLGTGGVDFQWTITYSYGSGNSTITRVMWAEWDAHGSDVTNFDYDNTETAAYTAPSGCTIHSMENHRGDVASSPSGTLYSDYAYSIGGSTPSSLPATHTKSSSSTTPHVQTATIYMIKDWGGGYDYCSGANCCHIESMVFYPLTVVFD